MELLPLIATYALRSWSLLLAVAGVILFASASRAAVLTPGTSGAPTDFTSTLSGLNFVASGSTTVSGGGGSANFTEAVYSSAGTLDFMFQATDTSGSSILLTREANSNFTGFSTNVGYITNGSTLPTSPFINGTGAPLSADRSSDGSTVGFNFSGNVGGVLFQLGVLGTTDVLVIVTNATNYDSMALWGSRFSMWGHLTHSGSSSLPQCLSPQRYRYSPPASAA